MDFECIKFTPYDKGSLKGFADIRVPKMGMTFYGFTVHEKNDQKWVAFPSRSYEKDGETKWLPYFKFDNQTHQEEFKKKALEAIKTKQNCENHNIGENNNEMDSQMHFG